MPALNVELHKVDLAVELKAAPKLKGRSNYLLWRNNMVRILQTHFLHHCIMADETSDDDEDEHNEEDELDAEALKSTSTRIQSTFHKDLDFHVWLELRLDSRKLWKELDERFSSKGKWAYIRCSVKLNSMQPYNYPNDDQYCYHEKLLVLQRNGTGVRKSPDIEEMIRMVANLPDYLQFLTLKWCVAEEEDLTAAKMSQQINLAEERYTMSENRKSSHRLGLSLRSRPRIMGSESSEAGGSDT